MPLSARVGQNVQPIVTTAGTFQISCHLATACWLFREINNRDPDMNEWGDIAVNVNEAMRQIAVQGSRRQPPYRGTLAVSQNSVIVFMRNGQPQHSCVARSTQTMGGYNQTQWFSTPGVDHGYSTHAIGDIRWGRRTQLHKVKGNASNAWCQLHTTIEPIAKRAFADAIS